MSRVVRKPAFCICESKDGDQLRGNREADQRLCFAIRIVQSLYYLNPKFQAPCHLLWPYSLLCAGPGRKPRRQVSSQRGSNCSRKVNSYCIEGLQSEQIWNFVVVVRTPLILSCRQTENPCNITVSSTRHQQVDCIVFSSSILGNYQKNARQEFVIKAKA